MLPLFGWLLALGCFLTAQAAVARADRRSEQHVTTATAAGYPFGKPFNDANMIGDNHRRIAEISVAGCEPGGHLTGMSINYRDNVHSPKVEDPVMHGKADMSQDWKDWPLELDEYVKEVRVTTWDKKVKQFRATVYHTRIGHIRLTTNKNKILECGAYNKWDSAWTWGGEDKALIYFSGSQGDAINQLQAYFIPASDF